MGEAQFGPRGCASHGDGMRGEARAFGPSARMRSLDCTGWFVGMTEGF